MIAELMNMAMEPRKAFLTMTYEYIPTVPTDFSMVKSYWLDIGGCGSSSFPAKEKEAFEYSSPGWTSSTTGRIVLAISHLHDGGINTEILKNGKVICYSEASYGVCDYQASHISHISKCTNLGAMKPGDEWSITAYYNTSKHTPMTNMDGTLEPVMGIALVYVAEETRHHHHHHHYHHHLNHHRALMIIFGCVGLVAAVMTLVLRRMKIEDKTLREVFLKKKAIRLGHVDGEERQSLLFSRDRH